MVVFEAAIVKSEIPGAAMVGWAYVEVPKAIANRIKPDYRQVYRVRGELDGQFFKGMALMPKGEGDYFLAINGRMRQLLKKDVGDRLILKLEVDTDFVVEIPDDLEVCLLDDEVDLMGRFMALAKSHRHYFIKYINDAKTETTRAKRIVMTVEAMALKLDFGAMVRLEKARRQNG